MALWAKILSGCIHKREATNVQWIMEKTTFDMFFWAGGWNKVIKGLICSCPVAFRKLLTVGSKFRLFKCTYLLTFSQENDLPKGGAKCCLLCTSCCNMFWFHNSTQIFPQVSNNLCTLQTCLTSMMGRPITMDQLRQDVGLMVEKITHVTLMFRRIKLRMEEYVCLKVIIMLNPCKCTFFPTSLEQTWNFVSFTYIPQNFTERTIKTMLIQKQSFTENR